MSGRNGHLFLGRGSNKVIELYTRPLDDLGLRWLRLFDRRRDSIAQRSARYFQLIVPEKSTVVRECAPFEVEGPSPLLSQLINGVANRDFLRVIPLDGAFSEREHWFARQDSHLSTAGAKYVCTQFIKMLGYGDVELELVESSSLQVGDLGKKFGVVAEAVPVATDLVVGGERLEPALQEAWHPASGHKGIRYVWHCASAPIAARVVVFGNSFFERGALSTQLSWWFSRIFQEFHFIWSPALDSNYVRKVGADLVVCQTIERFLRVLPEDV